MQPNEVLSLCFHFLCPDKETAHPIRLGRIRVHWSLEDEGLGFKTSENYEPSERWVLDRLLIERRFVVCAEIDSDAPVQVAGVLGDGVSVRDCTEARPGCGSRGPTAGQGGCLHRV